MVLASGPASSEWKGDGIFQALLTHSLPACNDRSVAGKGHIMSHPWRTDNLNHGLDRLCEPRNALTASCLALVGAYSLIFKGFKSCRATFACGSRLKVPGSA